VQEFIGPQDGYQSSAFHECDARAKHQSLTEIMSHKDYRFMQAPLKSSELMLQFIPGDGVERPKRLVHQENWGIGSQGPSHSNALTLSSGEFAWISRGELAVQPDQLQKLFNPSLHPFPRPIFNLGNQTDVARHSKVRKEADILNGISDAAAKSDEVPFPGRFALHRDVAAGGDEQAVNKFQRRGFARPAAPEENKGLSNLDVEIQIAEQFMAAIELIGHAAELDGGLGKRIRGNDLTYRPDYLRADSGNPVIRIPVCALFLMLRPMSSAVICSTMRAFSSLPPSTGRSPGILVTNPRAT